MEEAMLDRLKKNLRENAGHLFTPHVTDDDLEMLIAGQIEVLKMPDQAMLEKGQRNYPVDRDSFACSWLFGQMLSAIMGRG